MESKDPLTKIVTSYIVAYLKVSLGIALIGVPLLLGWWAIPVYVALLGLWLYRQWRQEQRAMKEENGK